MRADVEQQLALVAEQLRLITCGMPRVGSMSNLTNPNVETRSRAIRLELTARRLWSRTQGYPVRSAERCSTTETNREPGNCAGKTCHESSKREGDMVQGARREQLVSRAAPRAAVSVLWSVQGLKCRREQWVSLTRSTAARTLCAKYPQRWPY